MKKMIFGALALLLAAGALSSCDKKGAQDTTESKIPAALLDSTSTAYGKMVGSIILNDYTQFKNSPEAPTKEEILKGVQDVMKLKATHGNRIGMEMALQMLAEMEHLETQGVALDRQKFLTAFVAAFNADSISVMDVQQSSQDFQRLMESAVKAAQASELTEEEVSEETDPAAQNGQAAQVYIDMLKSENPAVMTTDSGLSYEIKAPGTGAHPTAESTVTVLYTGRTIDGNTFDTTDGRGPAEFSLAHVVPGFSEGLQLLGKGGKATLYMPGNLAYGDAGVPQAGIGPNEMLIFDVELVDFK